MTNILEKAKIWYARNGISVGWGTGPLIKGLIEEIDSLIKEVARKDRGWMDSVRNMNEQIRKLEIENKRLKQYEVYDSNLDKLIKENAKLEGVTKMRRERVDGKEKKIDFLIKELDELKDKVIVRDKRLDRQESYKFKLQDQIKDLKERTPSDKAWNTIKALTKERDELKEGKSKAEHRNLNLLAEIAELKGWVNLP